DGQRVWGGGVVKYSARSDQWYPWEFDLEDGRKAPKGAKKLRVTVEATKNGEISQNIHTGATPPWLLPDDDETTHSSAIGPSFSEFQKHAERLKKRGKNPYRVGANFDRTCKVDNEWLPSFGGVWNSGPRWQTRRSFKSRRGKQT
ncbi:centrosomal AT-AC splicing factor-like, partial [Xenia sp. Carnegie-2017]|uniref:centrosomal AT-AC splicing factor-like n=1 Tax=Xenia sp. Carnegie-2017 TaxID=2897299 RepID=UPI001F044683